MNDPKQVAEDALKEFYQRTQARRVDVPEQPKEKITRTETMFPLSASFRGTKGQPQSSIQSSASIDGTTGTYYVVRDGVLKQRNFFVDGAEF